MDEQQRLENIEAYVAGEMNEKESVIFQQQVLVDEALKNDLKAYQEMQNFLSSSKKNQFRNTLENIRATTTPDDLKKKSTYWIGGVLSLLALILFVIFLLRPKKSIQNTIPTPLQEQVREPTPENTEDVKSIEPKEITPPSSKKSPIENEKKPQVQNRAIASANYEVNPLLEVEIRDQFRGGEIEIELIQPLSNATYMPQQNIQFSGKIETDYELEELDFRLLLFTNKIVDYQSFAPVWESVISISEDFTFTVMNNDKLTEGLYYYIIEDLNEEKILKVGKLNVR